MVEQDGVELFFRRDGPQKADKRCDGGLAARTGSGDEEQRQHRVTPRAHLLHILAHQLLRSRPLTDLLLVGQHHLIEALLFLSRGRQHTQQAQQQRCQFLHIHADEKNLRVPPGARRFGCYTNVALNKI